MVLGKESRPSKNWLPVKGTAVGSRNPVSFPLLPAGTGLPWEREGQEWQTWSPGCSLCVSQTHLPLSSWHNCQGGNFSLILIPSENFPGPATLAAYCCRQQRLACCTLKPPCCSEPQGQDMVRFHSTVAMRLKRAENQRLKLTSVCSDCCSSVPFLHSLTGGINHLYCFKVLVVHCLLCWYIHPVCSKCFSGQLGAF